MGAAQRWVSNSNAEHSSPIGWDAECPAIYSDCLTLKMWHYDLPEHQERVSSSHKTWIFACGTHTNEQILNRQTLHHVADDRLSSIMVEEDINIWLTSTLSGSLRGLSTALSASLLGSDWLLLRRFPPGPRWIFLRCGEAGVTVNVTKELFI